MNARGALVCLSRRPQRKAPPQIDALISGWRHLVATFICDLKDVRRNAMRSDKTGASFAKLIYACAGLIHTRRSSTGSMSRQRQELLADEPLHHRHPEHDPQPRRLVPQVICPDPADVVTVCRRMERKAGFQGCPLRAKRLSQADCVAHTCQSSRGHPKKGPAGCADGPRGNARPDTTGHRRLLRVTGYAVLFEGHLRVPPGRLSCLTGHALEPRVQQNDVCAGDAARDRQSTRDQLL